MDLTPIPTGNDVQVNTFTSGPQIFPAVAALAGGGFVVTWLGGGQRYAADGTPVGSEFRVPGTHVSVAPLASGGFVVTWSTEGVNSDIFGQRYAADGTPVGSEFRVNTFPDLQQHSSSVAALAGGGFVVTWTSMSQDNGSNGIYGQRYAADGTPLGSEFQVTSSGFPIDPSFVAALAGGGFVVTWGGRGQRYAADGAPVGSEFRVPGGGVSVAPLAGGGFVVTWSTGVNSDIFGQRYAADGTPVGSEFQVNTFTPGSQQYSSVTALAGGGFVVTWSSHLQDGSGRGVYGQRYAPDGSPVGSEFRINQITTGDQTTEDSGTVATLANGRLVQVWAGLGVEEVFFRLINVPNIVLDDAATTTEETAVNIQVLANDGGFEGTPAILGTTNGAHGTVAVNNNGTPGNTADDFVVYTPTPDFNGTDTFTYTLNGGSTATVTVTVTPAADIINDTAATTEDTPVNILVLANDTFESTPAIAGITNGAHGIVNINDNGSAGNTADDFVVYTPTADFNGTDTFTYTVTSGGVTETATVSVTINAVQDAFDDTATVAQNSGANPINVLANDFFKGTEQIAAVTQGTSGTVAINDNGTAGNTADDFVTYTPNTGFFGTDTFTYTVTSPTGTAETATVSVSVSPDVAPTAVTDSGTVAEDAAAIAIDVLANDTDPDGGPKMTTTASDPAHGTVVLTGGSPGAHTGLTYQPDADFNGTDTFTYTLNGGSTTTVTVTVTPVADIVNDAVTVNEDSGTNNLNLLANDTFENPGRSITAVGTATHGTTAINNNATPGDITDDFVVYTPAPDFNGTDTFTYTVTSNGTTETATVSVTVDAIADIVNDNATTNEDTTVSIAVLADDTFEGTEAITGTTNGAHGAVTINNNGTPGNSADDFVVFTPAADFNGTDAFTYTVTSGRETETGTVSVTVTAIADIVNDSLTIAQDSGAHNLDLLANDTFENPGRSITSVGAAAHGTTSIYNNGTAGNTTDDFVVYTPAADYNGPDTFTYTVTSGGVTETGTVSMAVTPPPPSITPTSGNDDITGTEGHDTIVALAGDDIIDGRDAGDLLFGNQDNDTVFGRTGNDTIWGGQGNDSLDGAENNDFLWGNEGADTLVGGDGANTIVGGQDSSDAADSITAGSGPDLIWGNGGADTITADGGGNTVIGGFGSDSILTGSADDIIFGNQDSDTISGSDGANLIFGGFGADSILTGSGNDTIWGNEGNDTIAGGAGADRYVFLIGSGNDQINGFSGSAEGDRLDLQGQTFTQGTSGDGDVLLTLFGGGTVELNGVAPANFSPGFVL